MKEENNRFKKVFKGVGITVLLAVTLYILSFFADGQAKIRLLFVNNTDDVCYEIGCSASFYEDQEMGFSFKKRGLFAYEDETIEVGDQAAIQIEEKYYFYRDTPQYANLKVYLRASKTSDTDGSIDFKGDLQIPLKENVFSVISITGNKKDGYRAEYAGTTNKANPSVSLAYMTYDTRPRTVVAPD